MNFDTGKKNTHTALIIDDESDICFLLSNILRSNNLEVQFVNSINEGKSFLRKIFRRKFRAAAPQLRYAHARRDDNGFIPRGEREQSD